jgi:hypothetical protein
VNKYKFGMDILVACHNETEDAQLFVYSPPHFNTPTLLIADYVDPFHSGKTWKDYGAGSKDVIWDQYCPIMWPFQKVFDYFYHDTIFYNLFDDGWKILKPGGRIVIPFPRDFDNIYGEPIDIKTALSNFKLVLKGLLSRHHWVSHIVKRKDMPYIISEKNEEDRYDEFIVFAKPVSGGRRKTRRQRSKKSKH